MQTEANGKKNVAIPCITGVSEKLKMIFDNALYQSTFNPVRHLDSCPS